MTESTLNLAKQNLADLPTKLIIPYWEIYNSESIKFLGSSGFEILFEQVGMSLKLEKTFEEKEHLILKKVDNEESAKLWSKLFKAAFNYDISYKLVLLCLEEVDYFIAYNREQPVGSSTLYCDGEITGIHSVGIIPEMRRQGFAEEIMKKLLNQSILDGYQYATLQASSLGKGIYLKLGFVEQFLLKNYILMQNS